MTNREAFLLHLIDLADEMLEAGMPEAARRVLDRRYTGMGTADAPPKDRVAIDMANVAWDASGEPERDTGPTKPSGRRSEGSPVSMRMLEWAKERRTFTTREAIDALLCSKQQTYNTLSDLVKAGRISRTGPGAYEVVS